MIVVVNSTPLIYLAAINRFGLLFSSLVSGPSGRHQAISVLPPGLGL